VRCPDIILETLVSLRRFSSFPENHIKTDSSLESRNGQNLGFPLLPYLSKYAPFFKAVIACSMSLSTVPALFRSELVEVVVIIIVSDRDIIQIKKNKN
jgi:hypothetical protein